VRVPLGDGPYVEKVLPWLILVPVAVRLAVLAQVIWSAASWPAVPLALPPMLLSLAWASCATRLSSLPLVLAADTGYAAVSTFGAVLLPGGFSLAWPNIVGTFMMWTLAVGARTAFALGEQRGREAERARHRRDVHDTVLQVMESLALPAPADVLDPARSLDQVRRTARTHALRLRLSLDHAPADGLLHRLRALAVEMAVDGLRVEIVPLTTTPELPDAAAEALHDAAREALRNTLKHAGTSRAVVCIEDSAAGVTVSIRDHGAGFDVGAHRPGFGLEHSIIGRLAEVGGHAEIESAPGRGTRVILNAPGHRHLVSVTAGVTTRSP
jgi:signal transduction histidine kinase